MRNSKGIYQDEVPMTRRAQPPAADSTHLWASPLLVWFQSAFSKNSRVFCPFSGVSTKLLTKSNFLQTSVNPLRGTALLGSASNKLRCQAAVPLRLDAVARLSAGHLHRESRSTLRPTRKGWTGASGEAGGMSRSSSGSGNSVRAPSAWSESRSWRRRAQTSAAAHIKQWTVPNASEAGGRWELFPVKFFKIN